MTTKTYPVVVDLDQLTTTLESILDGAGIRHGALRLVDAQSHLVFTDSEHVSVKVQHPQGLNPVPHELGNEYVALTELGILHARLRALNPYRGVLITDYAGETPPLASFTPELVRRWAEAVADVHTRSVPANLVNMRPTREEILAQQAAKFKLAGKWAILPQRLANQLMRLIPGDAPADNPVLVHGNPSPSKFCLGSDGSIQLVSWAAAGPAPREADIARMAMELALEERLDLWATAREVFLAKGPIDREVFRWFFLAHLASSLAHAAWKEAGTDWKEPEEFAKRAVLTRAVTHDGNDSLDFLFEDAPTAADPRTAVYTRSELVAKVVRYLETNESGDLRAAVQATLSEAYPEDDDRVDEDLGEIWNLRRKALGSAGVQTPAGFDWERVYEPFVGVSLNAMFARYILALAATVVENEILTGPKYVYKEWVN